MQEYLSHAVVLDKQARGGDADARYFLFTERYGKIAARAKSSRKIVSKLAGHLEPGMLTAVRIIEQHGAQVVDALADACVSVPFADLAALSGLLGEWQPDRELWQELNGARLGSPAGAGFSWSRILAILGWDPRGAVCVQCSMPSRPACHFYLPRQEFFCAVCAPPRATSRFSRGELLLINV